MLVRHALHRLLELLGNLTLLGALAAVGEFVLDALTLGLREDGLGLDPHLPAVWPALSFRVQWRGRQVHLRLERAQRLVTARLERGEPLILRVGGRAQVLQPWEPWTSCWEETSS